jgi:hypothetical protein
MKITNEVKEYLKNLEGLEIISEDPLTLSDTVDKSITLVGIPAQLTVERVINDIIDDELDGFNIDDIKKLDPDTKLLLTASVNYADEFDMSEFMVDTVEEWLKTVEFLEKYTEEIEFYFGTNEELYFRNGKDLLSKINVRVISEEESNVLNKLFYGSFGEAGIFEHIIELNEGEEEELDDFFDNQSLRLIEKLKEHGWTIKKSENHEYMTEFIHENGVDSAVTYMHMIGELDEFYKKNK